MTKKMERLWVYFLKEQVYVYGIQSQDILGSIFEEKNLKKKNSTDYKNLWGSTNHHVSICPKIQQQTI